jgi:penicillin amidase
MGPIIPAATKWDFIPLVPEFPKRENAPGIQEIRITQAPEDVKGSNNWAVSGKKTQSGFPMLCNDPHLALRLPSIWYEIQLSAPNLNTYGVSLPGAPGIILGFNEKIAWAMTNAGSDVLDWYKITFKDESREEYLYDGDWHKTKFRAEEIKIRGRKSVIEKVCYTHHGPVVSPAGEESRGGQFPQGAAMRWIAHNPSQTIMTFYLLNKAKSYEDFLAAIRIYDCPAMNFVYADAEGNIAVWHEGKYPLRPKGQGRLILDGTLPGDEWTEWIPREHLPHAKNPERGFVSSANQNATDPSYPYYLGWDYATFERGARVNELLAAGSDLAPEDMIKMQCDSLSVRARMALPRLLPLINGQSLSDEEKRILEELKDWDFQFLAGSAAATISNAFWLEISERIWKDDLTRDKETLLMPRPDVTLNLILNEPESPFIDDKTTPEKETLADLALQAFKATCKKLQESLGPFGPAWTWGKARGTELRHLARIPGFGTPRLETDGGPGIVNATNRDFGPSWRMTVALGPEVRAWGIYPGGQSGNPGSRFYDNAVEDWVKGRVYEILFLTGPEEKNPRVIGKSELRGGR